VQRTPSLLSGTEHEANKRSFKHLMLEEIHEQPGTAGLPLDEGVERIRILACSTSRNAAQVGAY
jgi:glucosamine--fructose-6-phosphate aminotransferase (isomerizing)